MKYVERKRGDKANARATRESTRESGASNRAVGRTLFWLLLSVSLFHLPVMAQDRMDQEPGFVSFEGMDSVFDDEPVIEINIHGALLRLVAEASAGEDPELASLLRRIRGVYVRGYAIRQNDLERVRQFRDQMASELEHDGWDTFVRARERSEEVNFYVRLLNGEIDGIVVMSVDMLKDQTVFLNIVGNIDPEQIGRIGRKFGVNGMKEF